MVEQIKNLRIKIDSLAQLTIMSNTFEIGGTREMEESKTSLLLAKAWLGKLLEELKVESPYKNDGNRKTIEDIEPTADKSNGSRDLFKNVIDFTTANHIVKVDWLRQGIKVVTNEVKELNTVNQSREFAIARTNGYTHLCEARFWLGFELERMKNGNRV